MAEQLDPETPGPVEFDTLEVSPKGRGLGGHTLTMRRPSVRFLIAWKRGQADDETYWEEILDAIITHDLDREPDRLTAAQVNAVGSAWLDAMKDAAVPPASGTD